MDRMKQRENFVWSANRITDEVGLISKVLLAFWRCPGRLSAETAVILQFFIELNFKIQLLHTVDMVCLLYKNQMDNDIYFQNNTKKKQINVGMTIRILI